MTWLPVAITAYLLMAIAATIDKLMMSGKSSHPAAFAFFVSVLSVLALVLAPFGMTFLSPYWLMIALAAGAALTVAVLFYFTAVYDNDSTRVLPFTSGVTPLCLFVLAYLFLGERFRLQEWLAFIILVAAAILVSANFFGGKKGQLKNVHNLIFAAVFFALSYFLTKLAYQSQPFLSVFLWSRLGSVFAGLLFLLVPAYRSAIVATLRQRPAKKQKTPGIFLAGQVAGATGIFLMNYAIHLGSVTLVNALQGMQSVFLLGIIGFLEARRPKLLTENFNRREFWQRAAAVVLIFMGLGLLAFSSPAIS